MRQFHLVIVDTAQIQPYIFGSNRLRENIGASWLVAQATGDWACDVVKATAPGRHNLDEHNQINPALCIEDGEIDAEVLYAGGGNFVVILRRQEQPNLVCDFKRRLSRKVLADAPGLQLVIADEGFDWDAEQPLHKVLDEVFFKLARLKRTASVSAPLLGLSVTAICGSTGLPAVEVTPKIKTDPGYPASADILAKLRRAFPDGERPSAANQRLHDMITPPHGFTYPNDFDELGRSHGEQSFVAVVHADGNGMGKRIQQIGARYPDKRQYIRALREFSEHLNEAGRQSLISTVGQLCHAVQEGCITHQSKTAEPVRITRLELGWDDDGRLFLPFRPLVYGGDDVAFVCDGRLGISLAINFLTEFERLTANLPDQQGRATACAGIAIVKSHYPFARAYELAEALCRKAKEFRRENEKNFDDSCLDWHFALSGLAGDIKEIRRREYMAEYLDRSSHEYQTHKGLLTLRPVSLHENLGHERHSWPVIEAGIQAFQDTVTASAAQPQWINRRNKVKALREALRRGPNEVEAFRIRFNRTKQNPTGNLPDVLPSEGDWKTKGWHGGFCGYFDAIELADSYIPLNGDHDADSRTEPGTDE